MGFERNLYLIFKTVSTTWVAEGLIRRTEVGQLCIEILQEWQL